MTDYLKDRITRDRKDFDLYETDFDLAWGEIDEKLDKLSGVTKIVAQERSLWPRIAAAVALVLAATVVLLWQLSKPASQSHPTLSMVSVEMAETEQYYAMMISEKMSEIEANGKWIDQEVIGDLKALDQAYNELRNDLTDNMDNEGVINAMIINYKIKLEVLDRILAQIKEAKNEAESSGSSL